MNTAALYLHLRALGLCLEVVDRPERGDDRKIKTSGLKNLSPRDDARQA
jgi:hypothetical protein